jgi:predicted translin family RNA/ssDNA-binding protein
MQEYVEAVSYLTFVKDKKIPSRKQLGVESEEYLSGLCDLSGELVRKAVDLAINGDIKTVKEIKAFLEEFYGLLLELNPYGELRKKADQARWNLNKLEDLVYENKIRGR